MQQAHRTKQLFKAVCGNSANIKGLRRLMRAEDIANLQTFTGEYRIKTHMMMTVLPTIPMMTDNEFVFMGMGITAFYGFIRYTLAFTVRDFLETTKLLAEMRTQHNATQATSGLVTIQPQPQLQPPTYPPMC